MTIRRRLAHAGAIALTLGSFAALGVVPGPSPEVMAVSPSSLTWVTPKLDSPTVIPITQFNRDLNLPLDRDFVISMPPVAITGPNGLRINGGRNVVLVGGAISLSGTPAGTPFDQRRGLVLQNQTGIVHIEGLQISGRELSEGIQIASPEAIVQLQNIRITRVSADEQRTFHSDVLQVWGGVRELRVDGLTGSSDFQGIFLKSDVRGAPIGSVDLRRVNLIGGGNAGYLFYADPAVGSVRVSDVWGIPGDGKEWQWSAFPHLPNALWSEVRRGRPPDGDFVPAGSVGPEYAKQVGFSPGFAPSLSVADAEAQEPRRPDEVRSLQVVVSLDRASGAKVYVPFRVEAVTATPGVDFREPTGGIWFDPGQTEKRLWIRLAYDGVVEGTEQFRVVLGESMNATVSRRVGVATIVDG